MEYGRIEELLRRPGLVFAIPIAASTITTGATMTEASFPLSPVEIDGFAGRSAALGELLRGGEMTRLVTAYQREDARATEEQMRFVRVATDLNAAVLFTGAISTLILVLGLLQPGLEDIASSRAPSLATWVASAIRAVLATLGFAGLLVGGYSAARLYELNAGDLASSWMRSRAQAEHLRGEYFERLATRAAASDIASRSAALDLVIKHLLEDQLGYFCKRGKLHQAAAQKWLRWAGFASGIASVGVAAGGMAGTAVQPWILAIAALGSIGGAVAGFATAQESIGQERERAQRFRNNVDALEQLSSRIDDMKDTVAAGSSEALTTFTSAINHQLALELGRFLAGGENIRTSLAKLGQQIEESRKQRGRVNESAQVPGQ